MARYLILIFFNLPVPGTPAFGSLLDHVAWEFSGVLSGPQHGTLLITAHIAPGWYIFSQEAGDNTLATQIIVGADQEAFRVGKAAEQGVAITVSRENGVDMKAYIRTVRFYQPVKVRYSVMNIAGEIHYTICNIHTCIPESRKFSIALHP